jgi:ribosomal protein S18 acetylase RimI-like enzyme
MNMMAHQAPLSPIEQTIFIRPIEEWDRPLVQEILENEWGSQTLISRGRHLDASALPGFIAQTTTKIQGLVTYHLTDRECEIITLNSFRSGQRIGSSLIEYTEEVARKRGATRLWLITSNDNLEALAFYQKRGFHISAIHPDAITEARTQKPEIPLLAENGIPIRDEIELTKHLY